MEEVGWPQAGKSKLTFIVFLFSRTGKADHKKQYEDKSTKSLMMLPTDMALVQDKAFRPHVERYAKSNDEFFKDFSAVVLRLFELGVPFAARNESQRWTMKPTWDESK